MGLKAIAVVGKRANLHTAGQAADVSLEGSRRGAGNAGNAESILQGGAPGISLQFWTALYPSARSAFSAPLREIF